MRQNIRFDLNISWFLCILLGCIAFMVNIAVVASSLYWLLKASALFVFCIYFTWQFRKYGLLKAATSLTGLHYKENNSWLLYFKNNVTSKAQLEHSISKKYFTVLLFRINHQKAVFPLIIFADHISPNKFRDLKLICVNVD